MGCFAPANGFGRYSSGRASAHGDPPVQPNASLVPTFKRSGSPVPIRSLLSSHRRLTSRAICAGEASEPSSVLAIDQSDSPGWTTWERAFFASAGWTSCAGAPAWTRRTGSVEGGAGVGALASSIGEAGGGLWGGIPPAGGCDGADGAADPERVGGV